MESLEWATPGRRPARSVSRSRVIAFSSMSASVWRIVIGLAIGGAAPACTSGPGTPDAADGSGPAAPDAAVPCVGEAVEGRCRVELARGEVQPYDLAVSATHLYWTTTFVPPPGRGKLMRVALAGGAPEELAVGLAGENPHSIVLDETSVYWTDLTSTTGAILKMPLEGGAPVVLAASQNNPHGLAVDGTNVYWTTFGAPGQVRRVLKAPPAGTVSPVEELASNESLPNMLAVDDEFVYWTDFVPKTGAVRRARLDRSSPPSTFAAMQDEPYGVAVDGTSVYWTNHAGGDVMKAPRTGEGTPIALAAGQDQPYRVVVDGARVIWATYDPDSGAAGAVRTISIAGGAPTELSPSTSFHVAVDGTSVYWTSYRTGTTAGRSIAGGSVFRLTPKR
jgi:hypothetical protein